MTKAKPTKPKKPAKAPAQAARAAHPPILNHAANPIGAMNETAQRYHRAMPVYEFEQIGGEPHSPTFKATVHFDGVHAVAAGHSKQAAKVMAAKNWIAAYAGQ